TSHSITNTSSLHDALPISNAINIVSILVGEKNINLIVPGGILRENSMSLVGPLSENSFSNLYVDKLFLSTDGFDVNQGIFTPNRSEEHTSELQSRFDIVCR